jgi:hypothetical protein
MITVENVAFSCNSASGDARCTRISGSWKGDLENTERRLLCQVCVKYCRMPHEKTEGLTLQHLALKSHLPTDFNLH